MNALVTLALLSALWLSPGRAVVSWSQPAGVRLTCLYRQAHGAPSAVLIRCWAWLPAGGYALTLGADGPLDASYRAAAGDTYVLTQDQQRQAAPLRSVLYFPRF